VIPQPSVPTARDITQIASESLWTDIDVITGHT
jgi:hypothetical protein